MNRETIVREKNYNEFVLRLQYVNPNPEEIGSEHEPAIVIARPKRTSVRSAWIIMLSSAWKYVDDNDSHSKYMVVASAKIAEMLHLSNHVQTRFKIAEAILETLEELINMPPWAIVADAYTGSIQGNHGEVVFH
jgi:hypothetical protein